MGNRLFALCLAGLLLTILSHDAQAQEFELLDADRVVLVGDGFIERAQRFGYLEATLSARWPDRRISFRNIGWSGDTVKGEARDHYTNPPTAYEHLLDQIGESDPTVLIIGYGKSLAFEDEAGLDAFRKDYHTLLNDVNLEDKRCLLMSPIPHEQRSSPLPNVSALNANLEQATGIIAEIAEDHGCAFFDLFSSLKEFDGVTKKPLATNGIHLTASGYALVADLFGSTPLLGQSRHLVVDVEDKTVEGGTWVSDMKKGSDITVTVLPSHIPATGTRALSIRGLRRGNYRVSTSSGILDTRSSAEWEEGAILTIPEESAQANQLRMEIAAKNGLYFRKYRPQNETYLVGFRRYEQGQNAVELDLLDPLIHEKENEIGRLKTPHPITLTIERL